MGMELVDPVKVKHVPTHETFDQCYQQGKAIAAAIKAKLA
jgi:flavorubredoxin